MKKKIQTILFNNTKVDNKTNFTTLFLKLIKQLKNPEKNLIDLQKLIETNTLTKQQIQHVELKSDLLRNYLEEKKSNSNSTYYPTLTNPQISQLLYQKKEFQNYKLVPKTTEKKQNNEIIEFIKSSTQKLLSNFAQPKTPYNGLLIWHDVGVGKTCSALSIA